MNRFTVVLDACVLYPASLRDLLVRMALQGMFRAKWTEAIHEEWIEALLRREPQREREALERTRRLMNVSVLDCLVTGYEALVPTLHLPDPDDRHVLAAAIRCDADAIVTFNLDDFPPEVLTPFDIEALHPDTFLCNQLDTNVIRACTAAQQCRKALSRPPLTVDEYLSVLKKQNLPNAVHRLRACRDLL